MFKKILNPTLYHGAKKKTNFFEGWYYKITDKENKHSFAFIPGIIKGKNKYDGHSFIQILNGNKKETTYLTYTVDSFKFSHKPFKIEIYNNYFSLQEIKFNHYDKNIQIIGALKLVDLVKWPDSIWNPGSMGFYNYLSFMECYSHVCCIDGYVIGKLLINHEEIDFTGGKIYIEKNWGKRFPENYIWVQANNFPDKDIALTVSIGKVPFKCFYFNGFLTAFLWNTKVYKFTTINHSKVEINHTKNKINLSFQNNNHELNVDALIDKNDFITIKGPVDGKMNRDVLESITSIVKVEFIDLHREIILFSGISQNSGLEFMGDLDSLSNKKVYNE